VNEDEREAIRAKHQAAEATIGSISILRCIRDGEPWPCDAAQLLDVADEAAYFVSTWDELMTVMLADEYGCTMQCGEAEAAAALWRVTGRADRAELILDGHSAHDTEEDSHHDRGVAVIARNS
jgi:hypothetical protein